MILHSHHCPRNYKLRAPTGPYGKDISIATQVMEACQTLAASGLGSIVEACDSALPLFLGALRNWADPGAHVIAHSLLCAAHTTFSLQQYA